ncbi:hypothetical protein KM620_gp076 [Hyposidra talaca nucleopolyhedrovirus]|uniref:RING-type domain-containing protein n=1 Tax=Hyposidra talaca nucleopolyhedrovirus TaxID=1070315 RepID=A0A2Z4HI29_9ABAC|nr:hypothetical protein KM620_gp076 [Hyposidra talaca nucleopolyhedrovirus]AWW14436.1 hypothetical protein HytaNPV_gp076 [Hyposidra talaca nucleopolyhedrovirus]
MEPTRNNEFNINNDFVINFINVDFNVNIEMEYVNVLGEVLRLNIEYINEESPPPPPPLPKNEYYKYLKTVQYTKSLLNDNCCVCLNNFNIKQRVSVIKKCNHAFCRTCLKDWFRVSRKRYCPLCRTKLV